MPLTGRPPVTGVTGAEIAADAARYLGLGYVFGGDAYRPGVWDCSSFVSYVLGHDLDLALPGGRWGEPGFPPTAHGPVVVDYANWGLAHTISPAQAAPGDLICFVGLGASGHIGIVTGRNQMISALNPSIGTARTPIQGYGPYGAPLVYRRILGVKAGVPPGLPGIPQRGQGGLATAYSELYTLALVGGTVLAMMAAAAALAALVVFGTLAIGRKAASR